MAELQLTGLVADLIHREVDDPAELVAFLVHVALDVRAKGLDEHARELRRRSARSDHDEGIGREAETLGQLVLAALHELGDAAGQLAVLVHIVQLTPNNLVRTEGFAKASMVGTMLGAVVNIILDPIFI